MGRSSEGGHRETFAEKRKKKKRGGIVLRRSEPDIPVELPNIDDDRDKNKYYLSVSRRYRFVRFVTLIVLVVFVLVMLTAFSEDITTANLMYLMRDINLGSGAGGAFSGVSYSADPIQRFDIYRSELLYVTGREAKLFSATGGVGLSTSISYESPVTSVSEKYILIYDLGGNCFTVYNAFSELYREELDYPIVSGNMAESGDFVIVAGGRERRTTVYVYTDDFKRRAEYGKSDFVSGAALSHDGKNLILASFGTENGLFCTDLGFYTVGADAVDKTVRISGEYPLSVSAMGDGFVVTTTSGVYIYGVDGTEKGRYIHGGGIGMASYSDSYILLTIPKNALSSENGVVILDASAAVCYNAVIEEKLVDAAVYDGGYAFLLSQGHAVMIDIKAGTEIPAEIGAGAKRIIPTGQTTALLCTSSSAKTIDFRSPSAAETAAEKE